MASFALTSSWDTLPSIQGQLVQQISDIRKAPSGSNCDIHDVFHQDSELLVKVRAVATDQFTLYIEKKAFDKVYPYFRGGIHVDASKRKQDFVINMYVVKFHLPFYDLGLNIRLEPLVPALECPLQNDSPLPPIHVVSVDKLSQPFELSISYCIWTKDDKLQLRVDYPFPVVEFRLEYEREAIEDDYGSAIVQAGLRAIEDHNTLGCSCERKGTITSIIEFDVAQLGAQKPDRIILNKTFVLESPDETQTDSKKGEISES